MDADERHDLITETRRKTLADAKELSLIAIDVHREMSRVDELDACIAIVSEVKQEMLERQEIIGSRPDLRRSIGVWTCDEIIGRLNARRTKS
jgi:hypothetical protein